MKYYKILSNNEFINIASSRNFITYSPIAECFLHTDEQQGEYIEVDSQLYRSTWMAPIIKHMPFVEAAIIEITEEEYYIFAAAIASHEPPIIPSDEEDEEDTSGHGMSPIDAASLEYVKEAKVTEMNNACHTTIESGFDLELQGIVHHFSLTIQDQLNLFSLSALAQTQELIPYHADGETCIFYSSEEINAIVEAAENFKIYQTTYYNALKNYINSLETIEEVSAIEYGTVIPEQYKSIVLKVLDQ